MPDPAKNTLLVVDGHSLAFRAFYALPVDSFVTRDGQHTNAIHGFLAMLIMLLKNEQPTHLAVAFDVSRASFRTRDYSEYKATRGETPPEFAGQIGLLQESLTALNVPVLTKEDYEADDILATLAARGREQGFRVLLVSGDRDTIQLVNDDVTLLYPSRQGVSDLTRYDPAKVRDRYGIEPHQYPDVAALVGETSDNLPGIPKVGEKTAVKWLGLYGSLDGVLQNADRISGKVGESLREHRENAVRNRRLNALVTDLDLGTEPGDLVRRPIDEEAMRAIFGRLEFRALLDRVLQLDGSGGTPSADPVTRTAEAPAHDEVSGESLSAWLDEAERAGRPVALACHDAGDGRLEVGLATTTSSALAHWSPEAPDEDLEEWLAGPRPKTVNAAKPLVKGLRRRGLDLGGLADDTLVSAWLLRPGSPDRTLAALVERYLDETLAQPDPNQLVPETEPPTAATEAWYVARVASEIAALTDEGTRAVLRDIEMPTLMALVDMETAGVAVDHGLLSALSGELASRADDLAARAYAEIGREVNLGSPKQLQEVLFDQLQMPKTRANKTGYSTDAGALADLQESSPHPFLGLLLEHRDVTKLRQIVETLDKSIAGDGRIHTDYVQTGTSTGRISSTDPNLQNIPVRAEDGRRIRGAFRVGEGFETLLTADYSQIEMRIMAHLSGDAGLIQAFNEGEDLHRFVGARIFHVDPSDVTAVMRTKVKAMSYGLAYGLSAFGLSKQLRIETAEAKQLMSDYFERFGRVRDYLRDVVEQARADGYTETIFGRRRPFADLHSPNRVIRDNAERAALNAPIQGSAADIMKRAMIGIAEDLSAGGLASRMLMQVHDELVLEVARGEWDDLEEIVTRRMRGAADLRVPLDVQVGRGDDWDAAAH